MRQRESCLFDTKMERDPTKPHTQSIELEFLITNLLELAQNSKSVFCNLASKTSAICYITQAKIRYGSAAISTKVRLRRDDQKAKKKSSDVCSDDNWISKGF